MSIKKSLLAAGIGLSLLTVGCSPLFGEPATSNEEGAEAEVNKDGLVSITEYTGESYGLNGHEKEEEIGLANREEVEGAAKLYMKEFYNTDVEVQRISGSPSAVTVIVRSTEKPVFNTYVIVPVDVENEKIESENTFSEKGQVEMAIVSGLYQFIHEEEFDRYEQYLKTFAKEHDLEVVPQAAVETTTFTGFTSSYFSIYNDLYEFEDVINYYIDNPDATKEEFRDLFTEVDAEAPSITVRSDFFMGEKGAEPNRKIYDILVDEVTNNSDLPFGQYAFGLHDHFIDQSSGNGEKLNSIAFFEVDEILKEGNPGE